MQYHMCSHQNMENKKVYANSSLRQKAQTLQIIALSQWHHLNLSAYIPTSAVCILRNWYHFSLLLYMDQH